jgi:hypothetical protein
MLVRVIDGEPFFAGAYVLRAHFANVFRQVLLTINGLDYDYRQPYAQECVRERISGVIYAQRDLASVLSRSVLKHRSELVGGCLY